MLNLCFIFCTKINLRVFWKCYLTQFIRHWRKILILLNQRIWKVNAMWHITFSFRRTIVNMFGDGILKTVPYIETRKNHSSFLHVHRICTVKNLKRKKHRADICQNQPPIEKRENITYGQKTRMNFFSFSLLLLYGTIPKCIFSHFLSFYSNE